MSAISSVLRFSDRQYLPLIMQDERAECGHACVAMLSYYWGLKFDLFTLREIDKPSLAGANLRELMALLERLGFRSRALSVPLDELKYVKTPAIIHWNMNHFVVLKSVKQNRVVIHDPAEGVRSCAMHEVSKAFTGIVLEVEPAANFKCAEVKSGLSLLDLLKTIKGIKSPIIFLFILSLCIEAMGLINPLFLQYVTDHVMSANDLGNLYALAWGFLILIMTHGLIEYMRSSIILYTATHLTEQLSSNIMRHLLKLPLSFFEARHKGDIQSKFQAIDQIQRKISTDFINTLLDGLMVGLNLIVMLFYSRVLSVFVIFALLLSLLIRYASYLSFKKEASASIHLHGKTASTFLETLQGIMPIKAYSMAGSRLRRWQNDYIDALNADIRVSRMQNRYHVVNTLLFNLELLLVTVVGAHLVIGGNFTVGMLVAFLAYRLSLVNKASSLFQHLFDYKLIAIQLGRLADILHQKPEQEDSGLNLDYLDFRKSLSLKNISFRHQSSKNYLFHELNLEIFSCEKVAIIGPSGSGKTTLLKIMMGLLSPTEGDIYLDGHLVSSLGLKKYRSLMASVMQEDELFSGSIMDNIVFFDDCIDMPHVHYVAQLACIHETIEALPMGYETLLGDMGSTLSGGQKQRILLARALYKRPKILFLDEATSHLDDENEQKINQALKLLNITQIIVAHREQTIKQADRVISIGADGVFRV